MYTHMEGSRQVKCHFILQECLLAFYFFFLLRYGFPLAWNLLSKAKLGGQSASLIVP